MFEITQKEQILKNVRKGLVQPVPNAYPLLDTDSPALNPSQVPADETFLVKYTSEGNFFAVCDNTFDFLSRLLHLMESRGWASVHCTEPNLSALLRDNGITVSNNSQNPDILLSSCHRISSDQSAVFFSSEFQNLKAIRDSQVLLVYATHKQIEAAGVHSVFNELSVKRDLKVAFDISLMGENKEIYLFLNTSS